ncbi:MAG: fibronectin type III domain-containing protein, partial [Verrucomicrobiales bacterium]
MDFVAGALGANTNSDVTVLFQSGTQEGTNVFSGMDNLVWSPDGCIYVNEDDTEGDIWKIDVDSLLASYAANDFTPSAAQVGDILDSDYVSESSGIIDVSVHLGYEPGGVFLTSGQSGTLSLNQLAMLVSPTATLINDEECPPFLPGENVGTVENSSLDEISGLAVSRDNPGVFWVHNDSGDTARIFALNSSGTHLGEYSLSGAAAVDYEDIAIGPGPVEGTDYLYIADTGNNALGRSTVVVYRVAEPTATSNQAPVSSTLSGIDALPMTFPGTTKYDCETLLVDPKSGDIYLVSRDRDAVSGKVSFVFRNPAPHVAGVNVTLELVTSFSAPEEIKGGDISPDGTQILLRSGKNDAQVDARWWSWDTTSSLVTVFARPGCFVPAALEPQGEAIAFAPDGLSYYTISEDPNQPIYHYTLATPPAAPSSLAAATQSGTEINLSWVDNSNDEDGFEIYESTDGTTFTLISTTPADTASALVGGLQPDTTYHYFVRAFNLAGEADSNVDSAMTSPPAPPAAPTGLAAVALSSSQIELGWNDNSFDEDGFEIYQSPDGGVNFSLIFTTAPDVGSVLVSGLQADTTYFYYVRATSELGGDSDDSSFASATTQPAGPTVLFSDGFESGDLVAGGWSVVSPASVTTSAADVGSYGALLKKSAAITKTIAG